VQKGLQILTSLTQRGLKELTSSSFTHACSRHRRRRKALMKIGLATYASGADSLFNCDLCCLKLHLCLSHHLPSIRFSKLAEPGNEMIFCDGCDVCVHQVWIVLLPRISTPCCIQSNSIPLLKFEFFLQSCYGVVNIPDGDWFCDRCAAHIKDEPCVLCPVYEGAMKRTEEGNWCHCSCVWWIPEVHFKDPIAMRPVMGVPAVPKERFRLKCIFCDTKNGATPPTYPMALLFHLIPLILLCQALVFSARTKIAVLRFTSPALLQPRRCHCSSR
jgi:hypothetical protein